MNVLLILGFVGALPYVVWDKGYDNAGIDKAHGLVFADTTILMTGETNGDILLFQFLRSGDSLWCSTYDNEGNEDIGYDVAAAPNGVMFVGGTTKVSGDEPLTLVGAFSTSEGLLWANSFFHGNNGPPSLFCRHQDSCYVVGWYDFIGIDHFIYLFKEDGSFIPLRAFDGYAITGIDKSGDGSVYLSSSALEGIRLHKYDAIGTFIWNREYEGSPSLRGWQCRVAPSQEIFLCGEDSLDFLLLKWNPDGIRLWDPAKTYDLGAAEYCRDMALDSISDCYLAGWQAWGSEEDAALVKTDSSGSVLWSWVDTVPGLQEIEAIEVDNEGYIYLAGSHHNGTDWDALVMKIRQPLTVTGNVTDSLGKVMKNTPVAVSGDTTLEVLTDNNGNYTMTIYNGGNYTLKPNLPGYGFEPAQRTYTPLAHREWNQDFDNGHWTAVSEPVIERVTLEVKGSLVNFSIPGNQEGALSIYSASGQLVERMTVNGEASIDFMSVLSSGVYFVKLESGKTKITRKWVLLK